MPIASILRTKYGKYPEYHTSLDNLENVVTPKGLHGGYWAIRKALEALEKIKNILSLFYVTTHEQRGLYNNLSSKKSNKEIKLMMDLLSLCDGENSLRNS